MNSIDAARGLLRARHEIPVFPLPNVVLFPHVTIGLHIFEPRYRQLTGDALAGDRLMSVALLKPGWEQDYYGTPPVHEVACAGVIEEHQRLPDGRFNIRLRGLSRVALGEWATGAPYRVASFRMLDDRNEEEGPLVAEHRERLLRTCSGLLQGLAGHPERALAVPVDMPFPVGVNALCQSLTMGADRRQKLLETDDVVERCEALVEILAGLWRESSLQETAPPSPH